MKTLWFKISKKLSDLWLLDNIETEYIYDINYNLRKYNTRWDYLFFIKTLTEIEARKFIKLDTLPEYARNRITTLYTQWFNCWKTLLEAIEEMLEYLLDNDLLWKE